MRSPESPVLEARGLSVSVRGIPLLAPLSLILPASRSLAVGGDNGSGKTTLLSVIAGLRRPTTGSLRVLGMTPDDRRPEFRAAVTGLIGRAPISRELTVAEYLEAIAMSWSLPDPEEAARRQLAELEIDFLARRFGHELSSGQSQLMQLAMVLIRPARLLVLDEPEQRLDAARLDMLISILERRVANGTTLALASHSPQVIGRLSEEHLHLERAHPQPDETSAPAEKEGPAEEEGPAEGSADPADPADPEPS